MEKTLFRKNIDVLSRRNPAQAFEISQSKNDESYVGSIEAKNKSNVVLVSGNLPAHSRYDPLLEAERLVSKIPLDAMVFFIGVSSGYQVRARLTLAPDAPCVVFEPNPSAWHSLFLHADLTDILSNPRVTLFYDTNALERFLPTIWFPALNPSFHTSMLRPWKDAFTSIAENTTKILSRAISKISADYSVQAHFGRLWFRNALANIYLFDNRKIDIPVANLKTQALVTAAGPSLESWLPCLLADRSKYTIFATDTSWGTLIRSGIHADFFVSIDAQNISLSHIMTPLNSKTTVVIDACAQPGIARSAIAAGCKTIITASGHPLFQLPSISKSLPFLDTSSGTVTLAARNLALSIGFTSVILAGADFCYKNGSAYVRGTYLQDRYSGQSTRLNTEEGLWTQLMFRSPVYIQKEKENITYRTEVMDRYSTEAQSIPQVSDWKFLIYKPVESKVFFNTLLKELPSYSLDNPSLNPYLSSLYSLIAWLRNSKKSDDSFKYNNCSYPEQSLNLALDLIAGYTKLL